jgi:hypothetical protein
MMLWGLLLKQKKKKLVVFKMEQRLENILEKVNLIEKKFYEEMIPVHEDEVLRDYINEYVKKNYDIIIRGKVNTKVLCLSYGVKGFRLGSPKYYDTGDLSYWGSGGSYNTCFSNFQVRDNILVIPNKKGGELLKLFPTLSIDEIYSKLEDGMKDNDIYQRGLKCL